MNLYYSFYRHLLKHQFDRFLTITTTDGQIIDARAAQIFCIYSRIEKAFSRLNSAVLDHAPTGISNLIKRYDFQTIGESNIDFFVFDWVGVYLCKKIAPVLFNDNAFDI